MIKNKEGYLEDTNLAGLLDYKSTFDNSRILSQTNFPKNYNNFHIMTHEEPHLIRRKEILQKHPEIALLFGPDNTTAWYAVSLVVIQMFCANSFKESNWFVFMVSAYFIGAAITHALHGVVHDVTHYLCFESILANRLLAIFSNFGQGVPSAITFGKYHADHHTFMGLEIMDPDLPSQFEIKYIKGVAMKMLFLIVLPIFYGIRPLIVRPIPPNAYEVINLVSVFFVDYLVYSLLGGNALGWILLSTYFGLSGLHPLAVHLIAEHYEFVNRMETYDYIGWANFFILNIGYHTEHHDFPMIPWTRLPLVRKIAAEYYENLPTHSNYFMIAISYVLDGYMGPFSRIIRKCVKQNGK